MQPTLCSRCKKNVAVVFISKIEDGKTVNEGLCLKCARDLGLPQVNEMMQRMGSIDPKDVRNYTGICIKCGACIKNCPKGARTITDERYLYHKTELELGYARRAEPELFL